VYWINKIVYMYIFKRFFSVIFVLFLFIQCSDNNTYLVEKGRVGLLHTETKIGDLKQIFSKDSLVSVLNSEKDATLFSNESDEYIVYSKEGEKLLEISPQIQADSLSRVRSIQIFDVNYKTDKGVSLKSTFKDINENYLVNKVETTLTSATLFIDELNATIAIDKKELGLNSFSREQISIDQIPDIAKIKYFTIWFN